MIIAIPLITSLSESEQLSWDIAKEIIKYQGTLAMTGIIILGIILGIMAASWIWSLIQYPRKLKEIEKSLKEEVEKIAQKIKKDLRKDLVLVYAEHARTTATVNEQLGAWEAAAGWSAIAVKYYHEHGESEVMVRESIDTLIRELEGCKKISGICRKWIKEILPLLPEYFQKEKEKIENKLKELPE